MRPEEEYFPVEPALHPAELAAARRRERRFFEEAIVAAKLAALRARRAHALEYPELLAEYHRLLAKRRP